MNHQTILIALLGVMPYLATASPPLIYEGTLTTGGQAPDPWPTLRFDIVDTEGAPTWSTTLGADGPIEVGPDGSFVAYLEDSPDNPFTEVGFEHGRALRVGVCVGDPCEWLPLAPAQPIGAVPVAIDVGERLITREVTLVVSPPGDGAPDGSFRSLHAALASLDGTYITPSGHVTIEVRDGDYPPLDEAPYEVPVTIERADAGRISIVGDVDNPNDVRLRFSGEHAIEVVHGGRLGSLAGITLMGGGMSVSGLYLVDGAHASVGPSLLIRDFARAGVFVQAATLLALDVTVEDSGDDGIVCTQGGRLTCTRCVSRRHADWGFGSTNSGFFRCHDCTVSDGRRGAIAHDHALLELRGGAVAASGLEPRLRALNLSQVVALDLGEREGEDADATSLIVH